VFAASLPAAAGAQNLVLNGTFNTDLSSWSAFPQGTGTNTFATLDADGSAASGSAHVTNTTAAGSANSGLMQCRPATAGVSYDMGAKARIPTGQTPATYYFLVAFYDNLTCSGSGIGSSRADFTPSGSWQGQTITGVVAPAGTVRVHFLLLVFKLAGSPSLEAYFDDAFIVQTGSSRATITVPVAASIHGANGTFFHSDAWIFNRSFTNASVVTLVYRCFGGAGCGAPKQVTLNPRESRLITDIVGTLFLAPETGGAIELSWDTFNGQIAAQTRLFTPASPPSFGFGVPAEASSAATARAVFLGVAGTPALTGGFRTNAGAYNPNSGPVTVTFALYDGNTGAPIGTPFTRVWGPFEAAQVSNLTVSLGAGSVTTTNAVLVATSSGGAVFFYGATVDNLSGDAFLLTRSTDEAPVP
jgi:hypothetical protein